MLDYHVKKALIVEWGDFWHDNYVKTPYMTGTAWARGWHESFIFSNHNIFL